MTITKFSLKKILPLPIILLLSFIVWFVGPRFFVLLQPLEKRLYVVLLLFLGWALIRILSYPSPANYSKLKISETAKRIKLLQGRFLGALEFLKKTKINKHNTNVSLSQLPWYLFIGPQSSGKTTLLANSNINFILSKQFKTESLNKLPISDTCDWWVTRDSVLIDVPSSYLGSASISQALWKTLINLIKKYRKKQLIQGIIIAVNLPEIMKLQSSENYIEILKIKIAELHKWFGSLPIYIVITKCDFIPGFAEFFSDHASDELAQAWGITFPPQSDNDKLIDIFTHRFNALIKRINKQLIWRLHQERIPQSRPLIKDFPLQIEKLKEVLSLLLNNISQGISQFRLQGIYLTSAIQQESENESTVFTNALQILKNPPLLSRAYFIKQLLLQGILATYDHHNQPVPSSWGRRAVYVISIASILITATFLVKDFQRGVEKAYSIQNDLSQYQLFLHNHNQSSQRLAKALPLLNDLEQAAESQSHHWSYFGKPLAFYSNRSQQTAQGIYLQALQTIVIPEIKNNFENYLQSNAEKNPIQLYRVFQAYLMLGDSKHIDPEFIISTIQKNLAIDKSEISKEVLARYISTALTTAWKPIKLNDNLIVTVRRKFNNLPPIELANIILKSNSDNNKISKINLGTLTKHPVFVSKIIENKIPNMFTLEAFNRILDHEIQQAVVASLEGNWIIGTKLPPNSQTITLIEGQLRTLYLNNYVDIWESLLANIKLITPQNLNDMDMMISNLIEDNSPLLELLKTIQAETNTSAILNLSPKLQVLNNLLVNSENQKQNLLYKIFVSLRKLHSDLQTALQASDKDKAIFQLTANRMQNKNLIQTDTLSDLLSLASQIPDPLKNILNGIASQTWHLEIDSVAHYLDKIWNTSIGTPFNSQMANRYPFAMNAAQEVNLDQFILLFGGNGNITNFYKNFLKPFVDETKTPWEWVTVDNQHLPFSTNLLNQLQQSFKIQRAFFPNYDNRLTVSFTLQPTQLCTKAKNFELDINGEKISYEKNMPPIPHKLTWPGIKPSRMSAYSFYSFNNQPENLILNGDWAWFRLVNSATKKVIARNELLLNFEKDGYQAKYLLFTTGHFNPFLPLNFKDIQLPIQIS